MNYSIMFNDGTSISGLTLNGNNFITNDEAIAAQLWAHTTTDNKILGRVTISGPADDNSGLVGEHACTELVQCVEYQGEYWFVLRDLSERELRDIRVDSRLDYLEMMSGEEI